MGQENEELIEEAFSSAANDGPGAGAANDEPIDIDSAFEQRRKEMVAEQEKPSMTFQEGTTYIAMVPYFVKAAGRVWGPSIPYVYWASAISNNDHLNRTVLVLDERRNPVISAIAEKFPKALQDREALSDLVDRFHDTLPSSKAGSPRDATIYACIPVAYKVNDMAPAVPIFAGRAKWFSGKSGNKHLNRDINPICEQLGKDLFLPNKRPLLAVRRRGKGPLDTDWKVEVANDPEYSNFQLTDDMLDAQHQVSFGGQLDLLNVLANGFIPKLDIAQEKLGPIVGSNDGMEEVA